MEQRVKRWGFTLVPYLLAAAIAGWTGCGYAAGFFTFKDSEKPKPEFTRKDEVVTAKLIPRAKNTSVEICFAVTAGGHLIDVRGIDFQSVARPDVDVKNFKSAAFEIRIDHVGYGGEAKVSIGSGFFTPSTSFYAFNPKLEKPWMDAHAANLPQPKDARELVVKVRDGGPMDADGTADGRITFIGGPRDSFWGYALGTLFIRFFGIFIVLLFLMIGLICSGIFFRRYDRARRRDGGPAGSPKQAEADGDRPISVAAGGTSEATEEEVAAIAAALHMHFKHLQASAGTTIVSGRAGSASAWTAEGRTRMMSDRLIVFNRFHRSVR